MEHQALKVAVISPGSPVNPDYVYGACDVMRRRGIDPVIMPHALGPADGIFASTAENRLSDFLDAFLDPSVDVILCSRGGYGCVQLLEGIDSALPVFLEPRRRFMPRLAGFSDISALHSLLNLRGIPTLHSPMAKNIAATPNESIDILFDVLLKGELPSYSLQAHPLNFPGKAEGKICGGNFATFSALTGSRFDPLQSNGGEKKILFIEDIGEPIYKINRMLWQIHLSGGLRNVAGILVGQFTGYKPDASFPDMETMIADTLRQFGFSRPVCFGFSAGHIDNNLPLPFGITYSLSTDREGFALAPKARVRPLG